MLWLFRFNQLSPGQKVECWLISSDSGSIGRNQFFWRRSPMWSTGAASLLLFLHLAGDKEREREKGKSLRLSYSAEQFLLFSTSWDPSEHQITFPISMINLIYWMALVGVLGESYMCPPERRHWNCPYTNDSCAGQKKEPWHWGQYVVRSCRSTHRCALLYQFSWNRSYFLKCS